MAYQPMKYQYETSPRKLKPEYEPKKNPYTKKKSSTFKQKKQKIQEKKAYQTKCKSSIICFNWVYYFICHKLS